MTVDDVRHYIRSHVTYNLRKKTYGHNAKKSFAPVDITAKKGYNIFTLKSYGAAMVSTGVLRYDKRGGPDNPVKMSKLKNKRQQYCCSCSVSCDAAL